MQSADAAANGAIDWSAWLYSSLLLIGALAAALLLHALLFFALRRFARRDETTLTVGFVGRLAPPLRLLMPLLAAQLAAPGLGLPQEGRVPEPVADLGLQLASSGYVRFFGAGPEPVQEPHQKGRGLGRGSRRGGIGAPLAHRDSPCPLSVTPGGGASPTTRCDRRTRSCC